MPNIPFRTRLSSILLAIFVTAQLTACSTEDNPGGTTSLASIPTSLASIQWVAPSEREDNSPISLAEIAGYRIYYGDTQGSYPHQFEINDAYDVDVNSAELQLASGVYYVVVTAMDADGRESAFSQEVVLRL